MNELEKEAKKGWENSWGIACPGPETSKRAHRQGFISGFLAGAKWQLDQASAGG